MNISVYIDNIGHGLTLHHLALLTEAIKYIENGRLIFITEEKYLFSTEELRIINKFIPIEKITFHSVSEEIESLSTAENLLKICSKVQLVEVLPDFKKGCGLTLPLDWLVKKAIIYHIQEKYCVNKQITSASVFLVEKNREVIKLKDEIRKDMLLTDGAHELFQSILSIPDKDVNDYRSYFLPICPIILPDLLEMKILMAHNIVYFIFGGKEADQSHENYLSIKNGELPQFLPEKQIKTIQEEFHILELLALLNLVPTISEGRRKIQQNAVKVDGKKIDKIDYKVASGNAYIVQVGKKFKKAKIIYVDTQKAEPHPEN